MALAGELHYTGTGVPRRLIERARALASDAPSDQALLLSLTTQRHAGSPVTDDVLDELAEFERASIDGGELFLALRALELRCAATFVRGDLAAARRLLARFDVRLSRTPSPRHRWASALYRALLTDLEHGIRAAEGPAGEALALGKELELPDAENAYAIFLLAYCLRTGVLADMEPIIRSYLASDRAIPAWHALHAASLRAGGDAVAARAAAEQFRLEYTGADMMFPDLGLAMEILATAGDRKVADVCDWASAELSAWSGQLIVVGAGAGCVGPVDAYVALARTGDDPEWARTWHEGPWQHLTDEMDRITGRHQAGG
ncbi:MAG: hypothetical protein R2715_03040 [Ilumatobacteraceae bacterium]